VQAELVDRAACEVLVHRRGTTSARHLASPAALSRLRERRLDPVGDEVERRATLHR
jgi:hypothetical protein